MFHILFFHIPTCISVSLYQANLTHLPRTEFVAGVGNGIAKCPFDPDDNSTAVWVEHGNPGELAGLYSGTVAEFTKADNVIFRTDLYNATTKRRKYWFKRTIKYDSKWLDSKWDVCKRRYYNGIKLARSRLPCSVILIARSKYSGRYLQEKRSSCL